MVLGLPILSNFGRNLAECNEIRLIFLQIYGDLAGFIEIWPKSPNIDGVKVGLTGVLAKLAISDRERTSLWAGWDYQFLKQPNNLSN